MTTGEGKTEVIDINGRLARDEDFVRAAGEALVQAALEAEMTSGTGAAGGARRDPGVVALRQFQPLVYHPDWQAGVAGAAGSDGAVLDRTVRAQQNG